MAYNKVIYNGTTLIDLTEDTISSDLDVVEGKIFHYPDGTMSRGAAVLAVPISISTEEEMTAVLIEENQGKAYKYVGTTGTYTYGDIYIVEAE